MKVNKTFEEPDGHVTKVLGLASDAESLKRDVIEVLEQVWIATVLKVKKNDRRLGDSSRARGSDA